MKRIIYLLILPFFTGISCNDDFPLNADWSDITVVYGLLNQSDSVQYLKINKAFLGELDATEMAKDADSVQYSKTIDVHLVEYQLRDNNLNPYYNENWKETGTIITLEPTNEIAKDSTDSYGNPGVFGTQLNILYKTNYKIKSGYKYKLEITIPGKEELVSSETFMINDFSVTTPPSTSTAYQVHMEYGYTDNKKPFSAEWYVATFGKIYQAVLRFNYMEIDGTDTTWQYADILYQDQVYQYLRLPSDVRSEKMYQKMGGIDFFQSLAEKIPVKEGVKRKAGKLDFYFYVGGDNLNTYLNVSDASSAYGQEKPEYSNISNGVGIFDCRYRYVVKDKQLSDAAIDVLAQGDLTKQLNFADYQGKWIK